MSHNICFSIDHIYTLLSRPAANGEGFPQERSTTNWAAGNWRTFFLQANLREIWEEN